MNDIPYIESFLIHMRQDQGLGQYVNSRDFFATIELDPEKECKVNTSIFIIPGASQLNRTESNCTPIVDHTLNIIVSVKCNRQEFEYFENSDNELAVKGDVMKLSKIRYEIIQAVKRYNVTEKGMEFLAKKMNWTNTDGIDKVGNFLISSLEFKLSYFI